MRVTAPERLEGATADRMQSLADAGALGKEVRAVPRRLRPDLPALGALVRDRPADDWRAVGPLCKGDAKPERWFPENGTTAQYARRVCEVCPVRLLCLADAVVNDERHGVWGGAIPREITAVRAALGLVFEQGATAEECKNGHPWTEETLAYGPGGKRLCRQCNREAKRDEMRRRRATIGASRIYGGWRPK